ncbi:MAG: glycosyltransferase, partial [Caulobacteraceae bacterium]
LKHYLAAFEAPADTSRYKLAALREAADLALTEDRWGRDAPILLRAREAGVAVNVPWRFEAMARAFDLVGGEAARNGLLDAHANLPGTLTYSHLYDVVDTPDIAFDYLIDEVLPTRSPYTAENRLLMLGTSLSAGGMERIFANSFRAVRASGLFDEVRMALLNFEPGASTAFFAPEAGEAPEAIAVLDNTGEPAFPISLLPVGLARRVWAAYGLILAERPRVIHAWNDLPGAIAAFAGLLAGCPRIFIHFHHMRAINLSSDRNLIRSYPACYRRLIERPEIRLLFVAEAAATDYADWWGVERTPMFQRLYNGFTEIDPPAVDTGTLKESLGLPTGVAIVGTVFRFDPVKRPWLWIDAAAAVAAARPDVAFVMVGGGARWEEARARVAELGLTDRFIFPGQVRNVPDYLACFDLFMLTSRVEGLPNSLIEAQLAGVPVITADVGGAGETFLADVSGRLVVDADAERLASAALACLDDPAWMATARAASREQAMRRFGIDTYLSNLLRLYSE